MNNKKDIIIYSTPTCHFCHMAKDFFNDNNIEYTEHNVLEDVEARQEMVEKSGQMGVPVIFVGEEMMVGFDESHMRQLLGL